MTDLLEMRGITKRFGAVTALRDVDLTVRAGEIHAVVGENGAGKSTLMKVLSGVYPTGSYDGTIAYEGATREFRGINDSEALGIIIIHQELALIPLLSIAENIFLARPPGRYGVIDRTAVHTRTLALLAKVGLRESPDTRVTDLGVGKQQLVEIAKALAKQVRLLILDEPTASLNERDSAALLELLMEFRRQGIASILISHKLNEVSRVADRITVLRDGRTVETLDCGAGAVEEDHIIRRMVDRDLDSRFPHREPKIGGEVFRVEDWRVNHPQQAGREMIRGVDFQVRRGEIVGIAGLMGAGRTEFAMSVFGRSYGRDITGRAFIDNKPVDLSTVRRAIAAGLAYVTEDRKQLGLLLAEDIRKNVTLANLPGVSRHAVLDDIGELQVADKYRAQMRIRCSSVYQQAGTLSGGNQQKVVLSKWLFSGPEVLILDEPTRGIDVGAKYEIYQIINALADSGKGVVVISSEMPELLGLCDRIYVMNEGRFVGEMPAAAASQEAIMRAIMRNQDVRTPRKQDVLVRSASMSDITAPPPAAATVRATRGVIQANLRQYGMLLSLFAIMLFFEIATSGTLLRPLNLTNLVLQNSYIAIMALGMLLVIVTGHIDLSVGSVSGFVGALAAVMLVQYQVPLVVAAVLCLGAGALIGAAQGYFVAYIRIPSFIVTLAGMLVFRGLMLSVLGGQSVGPFPVVFQRLSSGFLPEFLPEIDGIRLSSLLIGLAVGVLLVVLNVRGRARRRAHGIEAEPAALFVAKNALMLAVIGGLTWLIVSHRGLPNVLVIMAVLIALYGFVTTRTTVGRQIFAVGGNEKAAKLSGIGTERLTFLTFVNMGVLAALAGLIFAARLNTATPKAGMGFELDTIAACFIGGASAYGGLGTVSGAIIGAFIMGVMNNGMSILGIGIDLQQVIKGLVLLGAVCVDVYNQRR